MAGADERSGDGGAETERQRAAFELLQDVVALDPAERERRLERVDRRLADEVHSLLRWEEDAEGRPPGGAVDLRARIGDLGPLEPAPLPPRIGPYRIVELLGRGGMGVVYRAEQEAPVRRQVALKVVSSPLLDEQTRQRFQAERQALARFSHPHIAQLYDAGATDDGSPYFVMELVDGAPITRHADEARLDLRRRLELFLTVCDAVAHAHQKGILHRDLKPSNLLVGDASGRPLVKVIDFGIAKAFDRPLVEATLQTGNVVGTPAYMSPEAVSDAHLVDVRSDVYSLGVVLYELLVGVRPIDDEGDSPLRLLSRIADEEPKRPSTRWRSLEEPTREASAGHRSLTPDAVTRALDGDLDWIVMKAIAKEPGRRYPSIAELAADLERHLRHEPVAARPPTLRYRAGRFVRRHRLAVGAAALLALSLVADAVGDVVAEDRVPVDVRGVDAVDALEAAVDDHVVDVEVVEVGDVAVVGVTALGEHAVEVLVSVSSRYGERSIESVPSAEVSVRTLPVRASS